ncbi:hypothetical protein WCD74_01325 [Actinomycetospora sp. OC33-EN08]|uniref:DUF4142 domain-containing protein n=1 Tax=Actinomycetospora aurantiaca TaxID=3129233 RepID=A0ABU8MIB2_9PSEU
MVSLTAGLAIVTSVACGAARPAAVQVAPDIASSVGAAGRSVAIPGSSVEDLARSSGTSPRVIEDVARGGSNQDVQGWLSALRDASVQTQEQLRDSVVDAACKSLTEGSVRETLADQLAENRLTLTGQQQRALLLDAGALAEELRRAARSSDPETRGQVAVFCWSALTTG